MEITQTEIAQFSADQIRALVLFELSLTGMDITSMGDSMLHVMLNHVTDEEMLNGFREECERANAREAKGEYQFRDAADMFEFIVRNLTTLLNFGKVGDQFLSPEEFAAMNKFYDEQEERDAEIYEAEAEARVQAALDSFGDLDQHRKEDGSLPYYVTARLMAASEDPDDPSGMDWDMWKDQMKEGAFY